MPLCEFSHNISNDYQNKNNYNDEKLLCSTCINTLFIKHNNLVFPHYFIDLSNITPMEKKNQNDKNNEIKHQTINQSIIEEIKQQSKNKFLIEEMKQQVNNKSVINGKKTKQNLSNNKKKE